MIFIKGKTQENSIKFVRINDQGFKEYSDVEFNDYFYIQLEDFNGIKNELKQFGKHILKVVNHKAQNGEFARIILKNNLMKIMIKDFLESKDIKHYEADFSATKRYLIDNHRTLKLNQSKTPYIFYDIETDDRKDFKYDQKGKIVPENIILSFAATDYKGEQFFYINEDVNNPECERKLLYKIQQLFNNYGVISGYNNFAFDDIYLEGRSKIHNMNNIISNVCKIDYMFSYKRYTPQDTLDSYSLDNVSKVELGVGKTEDVRGGGGRIYKLYNNNPDKLKEYNIQDTNLLYELNKKLMFLELHLIAAEDANCSVDETMYNAGTNDYMIICLCKEDNIIVNSSPTKEEIHERKRLNAMIGGGYTRGHMRGFFENAWVEDFESLYPSNEISCNISAESFVMSVTTEDEKQDLEWMHKNIKVFKSQEELYDFAKQNNYIVVPSDKTYIAKRGIHLYHPYRFFKGDKIAILPKLMLKLISERRVLKQKEKELTKQLDNIKDKDSEEYKQIKKEKDRFYLWNLNKKYALVSNYGLNGSIYYRFFNYDVIDSITAMGRFLIKSVNNFARNNGLDVIYNDTDSACLIRKYESSMTSEEFDKKLPGLLDNIAKNINNNVFKREDKYGVHTHHFGMEHEKDYDTLLYVKKKRYAGCSNSKIKVVGLESTQMNVLADKLQSEFLSDILLKKFNKEEWVKKISELHDRCFSGKLGVDELSISKKYSMNIEQYGGTVTDKKTGTAKIKMDGTIQNKTLPAHIELVKRLLSQGKEIYVGDKIQYIIRSTVPKQYVVSIEEFLNDLVYDQEHYWDLIIRPVFNLMGVYMGREVFDIIKVPEREELLQKIKQGGVQTTLFPSDKKDKLQERLDRLEASLLENEIDINEQDEDSSSSNDE